MENKENKLLEAFKNHVEGQITESTFSSLRYIESIAKKSPSSVSFLKRVADSKALSTLDDSQKKKVFKYMADKSVSDFERIEKKDSMSWEDWVLMGIKESLEIDNKEVIDEASKDRFINKTDLEDWQKDTLKNVFKSSPQLDSRVDWHKVNDMSWEDWEDIIMDHQYRKSERKRKHQNRDAEWNRKNPDLNDADWEVGSHGRKR